jgi:pectinesterase
MGKDGKPLGVDGSSTMAIESNYFVAYNIVFKNDAPLPKLGEKKGEAPALRVMGTKATFYNCTIQCGQGALNDQTGLHYFKACAIKGTIDFIFGSAKSFYEECKIVLVLKEALTLPIVPPEQDRSRNPIKIAPGKSGLAFKTCTIEGEEEKIYLSRVGTPVIYSYTDIGKEIVGIISNGYDVVY